MHTFVLDLFETRRLLAFLQIYASGELCGRCRGGVFALSWYLASLDLSIPILVLRVCVSACFRLISLSSFCAAALLVPCRCLMASDS